MKRHYLKLRCKRSAWHGCWLYLHCQLPMLTLHPCFCLSSVAGTFLHSAGYIPCIWVFFTGVELAFPLKGMQGRYSSAQTSSASCHWAMAVSLEVISISWQVAIIQASGFSLKGTSIPSTNCWASAIRHQLGRAVNTEWIHMGIQNFYWQYQKMLTSSTQGCACVKILQLRFERWDSDSSCASIWKCIKNKCLDFRSKHLPRWSNCHVFSHNHLFSQNLTRKTSPHVIRMMHNPPFL